MIDSIGRARSGIERVLSVVFTFRIMHMVQWDGRLMIINSIIKNGFKFSFMFMVHVLQSHQYI